MAFYDNMNARERQMVAGLGVVLGLLVIVILPLQLVSYVSSRQKYNDDLRGKIDDVAAARFKLARKKAALGDVAGRYANKAPPLGTLVDTAAKAAGLEIAVQSDVPPVPRGKLYSERATKLSIQKTGLKPLANFLEKIETSGYPVSVTAFDMSRRIEPDSYTVSMTISAFDRNETPQPGGGK